MIPDPQSPHAWMADANCRGLNPGLFYPQRGDNAAMAAAKAVCAGCLVRDECAAAGLTERWGVWGGLSEQERRTLRSGRARRLISEHGTRRRYLNGCPCRFCADANAVYQRAHRVAAP